VEKFEGILWAKYFTVLDKKERGQAHLPDLEVI
jgi:hypothetical protein